MASSCKEWPKATSRHHPSQVCVPCFICGKQQPRYTHLLGMPSEEKSFILKHFDGAVLPQGCMCREAARHITADPEYIPAWKREQNAPSAVKCMYQECSASSQNEKLSTTSTDTFKGIIGIKDSSARSYAQLTIIHYTNKLKSAQNQVTEATTYNTSTTVEPLLTATPDRRLPTYYGHSPWVQNASPFTTMLQNPPPVYSV